MRKNIEKNYSFYKNLYGSKPHYSFFIKSFVSYAQKSKSRQNYKFIIPFIEEILLINTNIRILDYGCGWGTFLRNLSNNSIVHCYYDISESAMNGTGRMLTTLGRKTEAISVTEKGKIISEPFDIIVCSHVLEHVPSDELLMLEFYSSLKDDGLILINVPINEVWDDPKHIRKYDSNSIKKLVSMCGFEILAEDQVDRWTSFLLKYETKWNFSLISKMLFKPLRLILALMPYSLVLLTENILLQLHAPQQYIVVAKKKV